MPHMQLMLDNALMGAIGSFGAALQELFYWYRLRNQLPQRRYQKKLKSKGYWIITALMIIVAGPVTWLWYSHVPTLTKWDCFLFGLAFPAVIKAILEASTAKRKVTLGKEQDSFLKSYFISADDFIVDE